MILSILRGTHIVAGFGAVLLGVVALARAKGGAAHTAAGEAFVFLGRIVVITAVVSSLSGVFAVDSRLGGLTGTELEEARDIVPVFFGVLGVLGLLAAFDLERGVAALRRSSIAHLRWLAIAAGLAGTALLVWSIVRVADGRGGVSWFGVIIGVFGVETLLRNGLRAPTLEGRLLSHATGMVDALFGFLAAFTIFGAGRLLNLDFFGGDMRIILLVTIVVLVGQLVNRFWRRRLVLLDAEPDRAQVMQFKRSPRDTHPPARSR